MSTRLTAEERRTEIVAAACLEFADAGYAGTSTDAIARRSGVSQPYLFQLFGTKKELFLAAVRDCFERTGTTFERSARAARETGLDPRGIRLLLGDRSILRLQLQGYAACQDPDIRRVVRDEYGVLWQTVTRMSGADPEAVQIWFAQGMLINVAASISDANDPDKFFRSLFGGEAVIC
jgi:AcrR family transcriptional regulator